MESDVKPAVLCTVGYAGLTANQFFELLARAGVRRVVDVRAAPVSRQKGFSKRTLAAVLGEHDIEYVHVAAAGNPYRGSKSGDVLARYADHVDAHPEVLTALGTAIAGRRSALLCLERDHERCHRSVLASRLVDQQFAAAVRHL